MRIILSAAMVAAMALAAPALITTPANAADAPAAHVEKIGIVNVKDLISNSKAGKSVQAQLDKERDESKAEIEKMQKSLPEMQKELIAMQKKQTPGKASPEFVAKSKAFETKMMDVQKMTQKKRAALEKGASDAVLALREAIAKVVAGIAKEDKYTLVITRDNVVLAESEMDITDEVMKGLNKALPDLKVDFDTAPAKK